MSNTPVFRFDFTYHSSKELKDVDKGGVEAWCLAHCKHWCFQLEESSTGNLHFQGRVSLLTRTRLSSIISTTSGFHWSYTSSNCTSFDYVMKEETRVDGPWADNIIIPKPTRDIDGIVLRPWQASLFGMSKVYDGRAIDVILNPKGNLGKTIFRKWMSFHGHAKTIPTINNSKDLMQAVYSMGVSKCYILDFAKAMDQKAYRPLYSAIEDVKSGYVWDTRYKFKELHMDPPRIFIFTNNLPPPEFMSDDRWRYWQVTPAFELTKFDISVFNGFEIPTTISCGISLPGLLF